MLDRTVVIVQRIRSALLVLCVLVGCDKSGDATQVPADDPAAASEPGEGAVADADLVPNTEAQIGDVTECPYSGRPFEVKADSPKWEYQGKTYVFCGQKALDEVKQDPEKYLGDDVS